MARPANTQKINGMMLRAPRPKKAPMETHQVVPHKCECGAEDKFVWHGVAQRVIPPKWQYTCSECEKSVLSYSAPAEWAAMEAQRLRDAKMAEAKALAAQKLKVAMMGAVT